MSRRRQKRRDPRLAGRGLGKTQRGKLQADPTLVMLLSQAIHMEGRQIQIVGNAMVLSAPLAAVSLQIRQRCAELGGDSSAHIDAALPFAMLSPAGGVH